MMPGPVPSACPRCSALLDHRTELPGGIDAPTVVSCPDCEYEKTFDQ